MTRLNKDACFLYPMSDKSRTCAGDVSIIHLTDASAHDVVAWSRCYEYSKSVR